MEDIDMFKSNHERRIRYSIRKFSVGVASVAVASLFMGSVVHATEKEGNQVATSSTMANESQAERKQAAEQAKVSLSGYMSALLNDRLDSSTSEFGDLLKRAQGIVEEYRKKIDEASNRAKIEELQQEGETKLDKLVDKFKKGLLSSEKNGHTTPKKPSGNDGVQGDDSSVGRQGEQPGGSNQKNPESAPQTKPDKKENEAKPGRGGIVDGDDSLLQKSPEAKAKGRVKNYEEANIALSVYKTDLLGRVAEELKLEDDPKFKDLINKIDELVNKYRDELIAAGTEEVRLNQILEKAKGELDSTVENFKKSLTKSTESEAKPETKGKPQTPNEEAKKLKALEELKKLEQALAEVNQYPELSESNPDYRVQKKEFWDYSKTVAPEKMQAFKTLLENGSYTEQDLQKFIDDFIYYQIHAQIEKMTRQVALYRVKYPKITSLEREFESGIKQTNRSNYGTLEGTALKTYFERDFRSAFNKIQQIVAIQETLNKLDDETKTVPDGAKLTGEAGNTYNKVRDDAGKVVSESQELLSQTTVTMDKLAMQLTKLNDAMSKLKEAKAKLVPKVKPQPENPGHQKPSTPGLKDKVAEAQKKVEEAEKKAKIQEEKDHRNYPTNTRKTIELEIAEAQVEVAKAELELAEAESQTPQDTDTINAAKAKVEAAKNNVKKLEKIKSDSEKSQAGEQKPTTPAPDTKPNHQSQPEGKQPSTPKEPDNKKPSVPTPEKPIPQPEKPKPEVKPQPETPKTSKIFTASDGKTKVTVVFDKTVDADKVNIKEVTTKELADKIARKTGGGTVRVFDLSLSKGGKETHVNGERTVRLALGQTGSDVHVYHVKENGDLEHIPSKVENGQVVFKTSHFSLFAIKTLSKNQNVTTPKQTKPSIQDSQTQIGENQTGKFQNKEVNPKPLATGNKTMAKENPTSATEKKLPSTGAATNLVLEIIGLLGLAGTSLIAMKRRK